MTQMKTALELQQLLDKNKGLSFTTKTGELRLTQATGFLPLIGHTSYFTISLWQRAGATLFPFTRELKELPETIEYFSPTEKSVAILAFIKRYDSQDPKVITATGSWAPASATALHENCLACGSTTRHGREVKRQKTVKEARCVDFGKPIHEILAGIRQQVIVAREAIDEVSNGTTWGKRLIDVCGGLNCSASHLNLLIKEVRNAEHHARSERRHD